MALVVAHSNHIFRVYYSRSVREKPSKGYYTMAAPSPMDATPASASPSDLEIRIARLADPNIGM